MVYAIISDSGQQFRVEPGLQVHVDFRDAQAGDQIQFDQVLAVQTDQGLRVGTPTVAGAQVRAEVVGMELGDKLVVQKFRRRKTLRRRTGHRQRYTKVLIKEIVG